MWMKYNFVPASLRGRVILGKGEKMSDHYDRYNGMDKLLSTNLAEVGTDLISRQAAIDALRGYLVGKRCPDDGTLTCRLIENEVINKLPPIQPDNNSEVPNSSDCISRQAAIDALDEQIEQCDKSLSSFDISLKDEYAVKVERASLVAFRETLEYLPPAEPEHTCVNCGRTVNNGGWYADGRTRCPIEEHYALPKDGFCHLWEKRNVTDDDYPERRTDE